MFVFLIYIFIIQHYKDVKHLSITFLITGIRLVYLYFEMIFFANKVLV